MKNKLFKIFFILTAISFLTSCAMHTGYMMNSASLSSNNFTYIKMDVQGTAKATYILGIGGLSKETLVNLAKKDLLKSNPLEENQSLANLTVNWKNTFILPFAMINKCTVTADIVEFK